ncbi:bifunctional diaminohydroxyphosphoribosylaminopyrimidine deaminase/5-amino-6-(5-phosphoribosylamino)uracil reductase RibD [Bergeyella sp. RCAD1439]|uniref:bifunctional diaminohydroxyphosphoribosylaminopyrimidine deaminase/5-amino-6-(5-phosphoribosylamino)uracil reductase RibD n=1 Tax=Bergeyella anatis TaxID=3113737 RepID=UPI002E1991BA|nr:bifunctional diaminohydroxyphosphoribosylaminopyrimidine deaminase/5-amino-6-(5-phosphoribosylamino)uracil reductase RibD [Bergeyella sp. RCAD1439]
MTRLSHESYMKRCIELAGKALGYTYPNPLVGCVIVHEGRIIGEGFHQKAGEAHAEINAIRSVKNPNLLPESTLYVSLEPCAHYGKTPPCALALKEIGFKKVVIGALDHHEKVNGKGIALLKEAGIEVLTGVLEKECQHLNRRFFTFHQKKRPYIILKWAQSANGRMDENFAPTAIGNAPSKQWVHQLRIEENAILVGAQTALNDNPRLTARELNGPNPIRILLDPDLRVPPHSRLFDNEAPTLIVNHKLEKEDQANQNTFVKIEKENTLDNLMKALYQREIQSVLVEGGANTLERFISAGLWDEAFIIKNPSLVLQSGTFAPSFPHRPSHTENLENNLIECYRNLTHAV